MKPLLLLTTILISVSSIHATGPEDRDCGSDLSNLWLDVVLVVDNSMNMGRVNLQLAFASIVELLGEKTRIGTNYDDPRSTRVALITYNQDATVAADLDKLQSFEDLIDTAQASLITANTNLTFVEKGLSAAEQVLSSGRSNGYRNNYKQMVILYGTKNQDDGDSNPYEVANRMKNNGVKIAAVSMDGSSAFYGLANDQMFHVYDGSATDYLSINAFMTNCYCRDTWVNFYPRWYYYSAGVCAKAFTKKTTWQIAKLSCQDYMANSYLATDFNQAKHDFLQDLFRNYTELAAGYHNGLSYVNGNWYWQQPVDQPLISLGSQTTFWNAGYPKSLTSNTGVATVTDASQIGWENINAHSVPLYYICEMDACDTENYCP